MAAVALGLVALLTNITAVPTGSDAETWTAFRKSFSKVANSGTLWAGVGVLAGWLLRRPVRAMVAGAGALLVSLVVHYGVGDLFDLMPWAGWTDNSGWFVVALVLGPMLGLVGSLAHAPGRGGLLARLVLPAAAIAEPVVQGWLPPAGHDIWTNRVSGVVAGVVLVAAGAASALVVIRQRRQTLTKTQA